MRAVAPNPNVPANWSANPRHVLMDVGFLLRWTEPESEMADWAFLKASPGLDPGSPRQILSYGVFDPATKTREMTFCNRNAFENHALELADDDAEPAVVELLEVADLRGAVGELYPHMLENDLFWPVLYWQLQQSYRRLPSEHKLRLDREHGMGSERFLGCNGWTVWSLEHIRLENPWLSQSSGRDLREIWLREIEQRVLYLKRSDYAVFWRLRYPGTPTLKRGVRFSMDRFYRYGLHATYGWSSAVTIGFVTPTEAAEANDREIIGALTWLRCLVPVPLDPFTFGEPAPAPAKRGPVAADPVREPARSERAAPRDLEAILRTPAGRLNAAEIAEAQRHFGLPEEPAPRYHPEKPPMLPKYIRLFRAEHPGEAMRAGWQERLKDLRRDAERAGAYEGLHYNARRAPRVESVRFGEAKGRPGITSELKRRLQPKLDEINLLRAAVLAAYEAAVASGRKAAYQKAVELDARLDELEADVDHALEQLNEMSDLDPHVDPTFGTTRGEGDEPMGFLEPPEMELASIYADWIAAREGRRSMRFDDPSEEQLAIVVRSALFPHGELRQDVTQPELVEAARDAYEAVRTRRERLRR